MERPLFSLIIPCHNPDETICRLFDSLTRQNFPKEELEIIVVDDNSDSLDYRNKILDYDFNVIFTETDTDKHCPGNTRRVGMPYVTGKWLFFCDQDDLFEDNILPQIEQYINEHKDETVYVISTIMRSYNVEKDKFTQDFPHKQAWLHGKWYSMDNLITPYNINFRKDLISHEDVYFNSLVLSKLYKIGKDWNCIDINTYKWVENPKSITRKGAKDSKRGYLYDHFEDYLIAAAEPYWEETKKNPNNYIFTNQVMTTLLHAYFYYEAASYYEGPDSYKDTIDIIKDFIFKINNDLKLDAKFIIDYIYIDSLKYSLVRRECEICTGLFIPKTSFRDFVYRLSQ